LRGTTGFFVFSLSRVLRRYSASFPLNPVPTDPTETQPLPSRAASSRLPNPPRADDDCSYPTIMKLSLWTHLIFNQSPVRPEPYGRSRCFAMMPSRPSEHAFSRSLPPLPRTSSDSWIAPTSP